MSDSRYSYDENSEVWPYFVITLTAVVTIPLSLVAYSRISAKEDPHAKATYDQSGFEPENGDAIKTYRVRSKRSKLFTKLNLFVSLGWLLIGAMVLLVATSSPVESSSTNVFNPYDILDLPIDASEKEIKAQYRQYTLKFHPDKVRTLEGNMTMEDVEARFVSITKAYKTLTDPEVRENYKKYGHPDGPQETFHGIALPKFLVDGKGSTLVVGFYVVFFAILLPYAVGRWWYSTQVYTKSGVHVESAGLFFETLVKDQPQFVSHEKILELVSEAEEYKLLYPGISSAKVLELLHQHLSRKKSENAEDEAKKIAIAARAPLILDGFLDIASASKSLPLCNRILDVRRCIVQAIPLEARLIGAELAQLPGADASVVGGSVVRKLPQLVTKNATEVGTVLGIKDKKTAEVALKTAKNILKLHVLSTYFKTPGEDIVPSKSQAHIVVRYVVTTEDVGKLPELSRDEIREDETMALVRNPMLTSNQGPEFPRTLAPYFGGEEHPTWEMFLFAGPQIILEGPIELSRGYVTTAEDIQKYLDEKAANAKNASNAVDEQKTKKEEKDEEDDLIIKNTLPIKPEDQTIKINTVKIPLSSMTPENEGDYKFMLQFLSKDYFGADLLERVEVKIQNSPPEAVSNEVYDIPEPDEDSIAGAVSQMRGESRNVNKADNKEGNDDDDDDDEEEEEEEDLSDIDTDTEAEFSSDEEEEDEDIKKKK
ncbi:uncharacterized protein SAPINGB_P001841 [Magnusiomyces paraingens]|uniref:J domain-containing protein n=1 Tax=Magnusiomyces paraingens TaxID=2606893 RepID=A0A5E8BGI1_9ASCO|nr:uncharacterized protein SAPINGB_P001841 [Saprochaete ingens]VVT48565.1 unnamed protein product [Saprochaete ingens]